MPTTSRSPKKLPIIGQISRDPHLPLTTLARVLLIEPTERDQRDVAAFLIETGLEVLPAPDGFYALMMLEKNPPDLVLMGNRLKDMDAGEFCAIVRSDPSLEGLAVAVMAEAGDSALAHDEARFDMIIEPGLSPAAAARRILFLLKKDREDTRPLRPVTGPIAVDDDAILLWGSLETMSLPQVCQAILQAERTGLLSLSFSTGQAYLRFVDSELIDASFLDQDGEEALESIRDFSLQESGATFRFEAEDSVDHKSHAGAFQLGLQELLLLLVASPATEPS